MTIYKPLKILTSNAAAAAVKLAKREVVIARDTVNNGKLDVPAILSDTTAVDKTNLESTVIKDGFHSKDEIYRGIGTTP
jgi:D-xylose transport system substrate-binding protein